MSTAQTRVRERLVKELEQVTRWIASARRLALAEEQDASGDNTPLSEAAEAAQVTAERETGTQLLDWLVGRSIDLRQALRRIDDGTYGECESCDGMIHPERLLALPEATLCLDCQLKVELPPRRAAARPGWVEAALTPSGRDASN